MHDEHPADPRRVLVRPGAAERAGLRLLLGLGGALAIAVAAVPLALLVRREFAPLLELDQALTGAAERAVTRSAALLDVAQVVTLLGDPLLVTVAAALLAAALAVGGHPRLALYVVAARVGAIVLSTGLKVAVDRVRPVFDDPVAAESTASFPSGHALGSAAFFLSAALVLRPLLARRLPIWTLLLPAVLVAVAVAASRVLLGVHYLSDVVAGFLLGAGWVALCTAAFAVWRVEEGGPVEPATSPEPPRAA
jgi:undecaprenyl-diphosphatase